ncbi:DUF4194 domain-containing protein [Aquipuribacter nitratireducens]|uniref:DUF4194 domain-containing protein n=1 Tax=Aquipuribacter nitratireducens TaxID=650104 RepID=A0ABW0GHH7_9MICO
MSGRPSPRGELDLSLVLVSLYKGVVQRDTHERAWQHLLHLQPQVRDHVGVVGLQLVVDESEGYAYLRQRPEDDDATTDAPRLVARRQLSFPVSLLLALLRRRLALHDAEGGDVRLVLTREQMVEMVRVFVPESSNDARVVDQVETSIAKVVELGFLRRLPGDDGALEVRRILKSFVDAEWLHDFDARLAAYRDVLAGQETA